MLKHCYILVDDVYFSYSSALTQNFTWTYCFHQFDYWFLSFFCNSGWTDWISCTVIYIVFTYPYNLMVKLLFTSIGTREINTSSVPKLREIKEVWCDYSGIYQSLEKRRPWKLTPPPPDQTDQSSCSMTAVYVWLLVYVSHLVEHTYLCDYNIFRCWSSFKTKHLGYLLGWQWLGFLLHT